MALGLGSWSNLSSTWTLNASGGAWAHSISGSNPCLVVGISMFGVSRTGVSVDCGGAPGVLVARQTATLESSNQTAELWLVDAPPAGTPTITVTLSGQADYLVCQAISYTGKTVTGYHALGTAQGLTASTPSPDNNVSVVHSDCWLVGMAFSRMVGAPTSGAGTSVRIASSVGHAMGDSNGVVTPGSRTLKFSGSSTTWPGLITIALSADTPTGGGGTGLELPRNLALQQAIARGSFY